MRSYWLLLLTILAPPTLALEADLKGILDLRASYSEGLPSYVSAGSGKFQNSPGTDLALGQLGLASEFSVNDQFSLHAVLNGFADAEKNRFGFTELFARYRSLPDANGFRSGLRVGVFYPAISLENDATAWSTPDTLTPSTINSWIGEELRATGLEYTAEWLGKFRDKAYDLKLNGTLFYNNDTAGAMLAWHGWTLSSRQSILGERLSIPQSPAFASDLSVQARESDPFHEEDDRPGIMLSSELRLHKKGLLQLGYFDSNTHPYTETNGQYGWHTRFLFAGMKWKLSPQWDLQGQWMQGDTLMQSPLRMDVVNNDYRSAYLTLGWQKAKHRISGRVESFSVDDNDATVGDNNNERGRAFSLSYRYQLQPRWFLLTEYNWINSRRPGRMYSGEAEKQIENQLQLGLRHYF